MRAATYIGGVLGLALFIGVVIHADLAAMLRTLESAGWDLLWLAPYRTIFYLLYAVGWLVLLSPDNPGRNVRLGYVFWATAVREAIDRLLPVASLGGGVIGVRLMRWRGLAVAPVSASVIVEMVLTLVASYFFTALGLWLLVEVTAGQEYRRLLLVLALSVPLPVVTLLLLRYGSVFERLQKFAGPLVSAAVTSEGAAAVDRELRAALGRRARLVLSTGLQLAALISGAFEIWFVLRLFGHPVNLGAAVALESMTLAVRHVAFMVPAGIGVQEAGLVLFGHALGIGSEMALAVSMAKRLRELLWGIPMLISWQWLEGRRLHKLSGIRTYD